MKYIIVTFLVAVLAGCASKSVPVTQKFPNVADSSMMVPCPDLSTVDETTNKLSDIMDTVTTNYSKYYDCKATVTNWIDWYNTQQKIYESVK
jgi:hypothetical protein